MSNQEALDIVDLIFEKLHEWGTIPDHYYGQFPEHRRHELADLVEEKSKPEPRFL